MTGTSYDGNKIMVKGGDIMFIKITGERKCKED